MSIWSVRGMSYECCGLVFTPLQKIRVVVGPHKLWNASLASCCSITASSGFMISSGGDMVSELSEALLAHLYLNTIIRVNIMQRAQTAEFSLNPHQANVSESHKRIGNISLIFAF